MRDAFNTELAGELLDGSSELPVMSFDVGKGQWFQFKLAGTMQVAVVVVVVPKPFTGGDGGGGDGGGGGDCEHALSD